MTVNSLKTLKGFSEYSYAANALERWICGKTLRSLDKTVVRTSLIESYEMAVEQFLKHIISHSNGLSRDHIHSHRVWGLACDAQLHGREKYSLLLKRLSKYYDEARYESDDPEERQQILEYLTDEAVLDLADELLYTLYTTAKDVDRSIVSSKSSSSLKSMHLF